MSSSRLFDPQGSSFIILLGALMAQAALAVDALIPAMPEMMQDLGIPASEAQLTVGFFMAGFAAGQIGWGWLSDWIGRRPIILIGTGGYVCSTFFCSFAESGNELIFWRLALGLSAAATVTVTRAMIRDYFTGTLLARKMAAMTTVFFLSPMLAPALGTVLLFVAGWRSIFWIPGLVSLFSFFFALFCLEESLPVEKRKRSSFGAIFRTAMEMIRHPISGPCFAIQAGMYIGLMAWISSSSLILTGYYEVPVKYFALFFTIGALMQFCGSLLCNRLLKFISLSFVMQMGGTFTALGGGLLIFMTILTTGPLWSILLGQWMFMFGFGMIVPAAGGLTLHAFGAVGGLAAAFLGSVQSFFGSLGSVTSAYTFDGTPSSLGIGVGIAASIACTMTVILSLTLHRRPELISHPQEAKAGNPKTKTP
ncbi:multidrug effflux MFS transporter [Emcibacter sp.]|uniref:multidrug effflux MFS transporter n=1 Tax=Emcibacter sp. TaxID=1979954 RepID=UPI002AA720E8|nr:multidrug effflux MFS transporter [Emcibacter sp.]